MIVTWSLVLVEQSHICYLLDLGVIDRHLTWQSAKHSTNSIFVDRLEATPLFLTIQSSFMIHHGIIFKWNR